MRIIYTVFFAIIFLNACNNTASDEDNVIIEYYNNGNIKYKGRLQDGKKIGEHLTYHPHDSGAVKKKVKYKIKDGKEIITFKEELDTEGLVLVSSKIVNKELLFIPNTDTVQLGDTLSVIIKLKNPKHDFADVFIGDYNKNLELKGKNAIRFAGDRNHQVEIKFQTEKQGTNMLKGYISDYTIKPVNDSIGVTVQEDQYFEYLFYVK